MAMFEADDLISFHFVMERLRDSAFFAEPYFELVQIIPAVEDGFRYFENTAA
ncbi:darcynin family protein [Mesorhizobium sp. L-8-3]|uniref:darcynin family protein n=1 Tax=Mesorhizobium sp. L-8-3 TaxID=2744522 RepID=UPI00237A219A|nr:darcynin family protein [Mesorhizobium sp. L-8-3]